MSAHFHNQRKDDLRAMGKKSSTRQKGKIKSAADSRWSFWKRPYLILSVFIIVVLVFSVYGFSLVRRGDSKSMLADLPPVHNATPEEQALSWETEFGQFPPYTDAEREMEKMLHGKDEDIDLGLANWLIIADIPEFCDFTREAYLAQLDAMTEHVRRAMARMQAEGWPNADSNNPQTRCQRFCSAIIGLHFGYAEAFRVEHPTRQQIFALYANPNNIFLAGLMRTGQGSCVSMPMLYLVIGQRLGMPVYLVSIGDHDFIRWDEPSFRMDIETTAQKIAWTPDDSVYLDAEGMTADQVKGNGLQNLSRREVVGSLFAVRSSYWHTKMGKCETQNCLDLAHALYLDPKDPKIEQAHEVFFSLYHIRPEYKSIAIHIISTNSQSQ